ncbi:hypothetical protein BDA96_01G181200 [Sorghum bicolor]|uniref:Uncharacterized protein n=1 Tax=Sorghum bicolor TaxID=4558 RepID=A0A921RZQ5_SORBI|nr:hypothetical protein BDA96_01G181200 [Sorghum bicolor]
MHVDRNHKQRRWWWLPPLRPAGRIEPAAHAQVNYAPIELLLSSTPPRPCPCWCWCWLPIQSRPPGPQVKRTCFSPPSWPCRSAPAARVFSFNCPPTPQQGSLCSCIVHRLLPM